MKTFPRVPVVLLLALVLLIPCRSSQAQTSALRLQPDSSIRPRRPPHYWRNFAAGFGTSILAHEAGHVGASLLLGGHPTFGFDRGRPTVYSGFTAALEPRKQFVFSSMGLNVQAALDETILDVPHNGGGPFERGVLASGIATALFYITIGRSASVSDIEFMARTSSLSKADLSLIYGGVAVMHAVRGHRNGQYVDFFVRPAPAGQPGLHVGVHVSPE